MNVIFLDVDGVLVSYLDLKNFHEDGRHDFKPEAVEALNALVQSLDAKVVISSTWRMFGLMELRSIFKNRGVECEIIDRTYGAFDKTGARGAEIQGWLNDHGEKHDVTDFLIIDDETVDIVDYFEPKKILKTNSFRGLDMFDAMFASQKLCSEIRRNYSTK